MSNISICITDKLNCASTETELYSMVFVFFLNSSEMEEQKSSGNI